MYTVFQKQTTCYFLCAKRQSSAILTPVEPLNKNIVEKRTNPDFSIVTLLLYVGIMFRRNRCPLLSPAGYDIGTCLPTPKPRGRPENVYTSARLSAEWKIVKTRCRSRGYELVFGGGLRVFYIFLGLFSGEFFPTTSRRTDSNRIPSVARNVCVTQSDEVN